MKGRRSLARLLAGIGGIVYGCLGHAGALSVSPTRLELSSAHPVATIQVSNEGDQTVIVQLERMAWSQQDGEDVYAPSTALVATPTVFELAPHGRQLLRVASRGDGDAGERAYRLYASEIEESRAAGDTDVHMLVRIGVPVFAKSTKAESSIDGRVIHRTDGSVAVLLRNNGGHFKRALGVAVRDGSGTILWQVQTAAYLLAKGGHQWPLDGAAELLLQNKANRLAILTEAGPENIDFPYEP